MSCGKFHCKYRRFFENRREEIVSSIWVEYNTNISSLRDLRLVLDDDFYQYFVPMGQVCCF